MNSEIPEEWSKFTLKTDEIVGKLTIDCEETQFLSNNNCKTISNEKGETYKSTDGGNLLAFIIPGGIIILILIVWISLKLV